MMTAQKLRNLFARAPMPPVLPQGQRIYAIGDVHGRLDLLDRLLGLIEADMAATPGEPPLILFLGDLIDRGPDSRGVIERVLSIPSSQRMVLCGNHEDMLLGLIMGERAHAAAFHRNGGRETLISYGVDPDDYDRWSFDDLLDRVHDLIPAHHREFIAGLPACHVAGDYLFVHAGIRPGVPIDQQSRQDMLWIRDKFTASRARHDWMVVHGHCIVDDVEEHVNRIAIDTGAYKSGKLTSLILEGDSRRIISS